MGKLKVENHNMGPKFRWLFRSMSMRHPTPELRLFFSKFDLQKKSHNGCNILSTHIPFVPCQLALLFLRYNIFKIWPWKSKVKVMGEVTVESHNMDPIFYHLTSLSFHVNWPYHSWNTEFSKFDLENPRSRSRCCTITGLDNSTELQMEKVCQAVTEIWVPQVWQPPACPPGPWQQNPSSLEGWGVNKSKPDKSGRKFFKIPNFIYFTLKRPPGDDIKLAHTKNAKVMPFSWKSADIFLNYMDFIHAK